MPSNNSLGAVSLRPEGGILGAMGSRFPLDILGTMVVVKVQVPLRTGPFSEHEYDGR
jgi:hypothetical protein